MANEQLISEIVSPKANEQLITLTNNVKSADLQMQQAIVTAKQYVDTLGGAKTLTDINKATAASQKQQEQLAKLTASRQLAEQKLASFQASEQAKSDARSAKEEANLKKIEAANNKAAEAALRRAKIVSESTSSDLNRSTSTGGNNTGTTVNATNLADAQAANEATQAYNQNTNAVNNNRKARKLSNLELEQANQLAKIDRLNLVAQAKEGNAVKGSLEQRQLALARLQKTFSLLSAEERKSPFGQRLSKVLPQLNDQVLTLEKSVGRSQRDVGNYGNAFTRAGSKAFSALRTIANILPGVGLAGAIGFAVDPIIGYISQLDIFQKKAQSVVGSAAIVSSEYTTAIKDVQSLGVSVSEFNNGTISKKELVDRYNESIGKVVGTLKTAAEVESFYNNKAQDYVKATSLRAQANAALELSTKKLTESQSRAFDGPSTQDYVEGAIQGLGQIIGGGGLVTLDRVTGNAQARTNRAVGTLNKQSQDYLSLFTKLQTQADKFAKESGLDFGTKDKNAEDKARKAAAARIEIQINELKVAQEYYKQNLESQNFSLDGRLEGLRNFSEVSLQIAKLEGDKEKAAKKLGANEILAVDAETATKQNKIREDQSNKAVDITKQGIARMKGIIAEQAALDLTDTERLRDIELASLTTSLNKGQISQIEYDEKKRIIENDYTQFYIELQIKQTQAFIDQAKLRGESVENEEAKLASIRLKYADLNAKRQSEANAELAIEADELYRKDVERAEAAKQIAMELFEFGKALGSATFTRRINEIEREKSALTERTNLEISNVEASTATEQEKADRIAVINARSASDQAVLDEKVKQQKIKQARFDKAAAIAQIILQTALAQIKVIGQAGLIGFTFSPLITALGAISLATAIATPIPEYKTGKGRGNKYSGPAIVGDGGMSELIIDPNGRLQVTPNTPTLTHVGRDTQVISGPEFKRILAKPNAVQSVGGVTVDMSQVVQSNRRVEKAIGKQSVNALIITEKGNMRKTVRTREYNNYIMRNFRKG